jgi:hypothetical protein
LARCADTLSVGYRIWFIPMVALVVVAVADTTTKRGDAAKADLTVPVMKDADAARLRNVAREADPVVPVDCEKTPAKGARRDARCTYGPTGPRMPVVPQNPSDASSGRRPVVENPPVRLNR